MNILFVVSHRELADPFESVLLGFAERGHQVRLAIPFRKDAPALPERVAGCQLIEEVACPSQRADHWAAAHLLRCVRDYYRYLEPRYTAASRLRQRAQRMLVRAASDGHKTQATGECPVCGAQLSGDHWASILSGLGETEYTNLERLLVQAEADIPADGAIQAFLDAKRPQVVLVAPLLKLGSSLVDYVKGAQALGIPVAAPVVSWDDLSAEGSLHVIPDRLMVWNERQKQEALVLHGVPADRVTITGAPRFDAFVTRRLSVDRSPFCAALDLDPLRPIVVFLGSSEFVAPNERAFVDRWISALRSANDEALRRCNVVVRPHPKNRRGYLDWPFAAGAGVALHLADGDQALFDCLSHSAVAVGLNTGALIEAGLLGRPAQTVLAPEFAGAQQNTLHFHHLLRENGGFVDVADTLDTHMAQLAEAAADPSARDRAPVERFVWASGHTGQATALMIDAAERMARTIKGRGLLRWAQPSRSQPGAVSPIRTVRVEQPGLPVPGTLPPSVSPNLRREGGAVRSDDARFGAPSKSLDRIDSMLHGTDLSWLATDSTISEFWKRQVADAKQKALQNKAPQDLRVADVVGYLGYGFEPLPPGIQIEEDASLQRVLDAWQKVQPMLRRSGSKVPGFTLDEWEHLSSIAWLKDENLYDEYIDFLRPFTVKSSMSTVRHYYRTRIIERLCADRLGRQNLDVLEIGAGAGNLAAFLLSRHLVRTYVIVDLPEMLLNAAVSLRQYCPRATIHFDEIPAAPPVDGRQHIYLLRTRRIEELGSGQLDLLLNFNSFMEMDRATRDLYIREIYRTARDGAIFYNVNRRQAKLPQPDGSIFDNNPLLYPYAGEGGILFWEDDPFETAVRAWFGKRPSLAIARAEVVRK